MKLAVCRHLQPRTTKTFPRCNDDASPANPFTTDVGAWLVHVSLSGVAIVVSPTHTR
jgi:hypothetical protein